MKVEKGKVITFHYTLKDKATGEVIETSKDGEPLTILVGGQQIIPALEEGMMGMEAGEKRDITLSADEAYGQRRDELVQVVPRHLFGDMELKEGMVLEANTPEGPIRMQVLSANENEVVVDMNHPLAGRDLIFEIELLSVRDATPEELEHGHAHGDEGHHHH
ncbi:MAG: peptidylprolyl isomerase [Thermotogae bacterium]|nr:peptidylprolyl isomerase [Thermotogota bacterium]